MMRPPTGQALGGVARPDSRGIAQQAAVGTAAMTQVSLTSRPFSTQGMIGARVATGTRQVLDVNFYIAELRNRITSTGKETEALLNQAEELRKREQQTAKLDGTVESLRAEVNGLQGELHDLTYAQSRLKEGATLEVLLSEASAAEAEATKLRHEANVAFTAREDAESKLEKAEIVAARMRADVEARIDTELGAESAQRFKTLTAQNLELKRTEHGLRVKLQEAAREASDAYRNATILAGQEGDKGAQQSLLQRAVAAHRQLRAVRREIGAIKAQANRQETDPEFAQKADLRNQIRAVHTEARRYAEEYKALEANLTQRRALFQEIAPEATVSINKEQRAMIKTVLRIEAFLRSWPTQKAQTTAEIAKMQGEIVSLLANLPEKGFSSAESHTDAAPDSAEALEAQLHQRTRELDLASEREARVLSELSDLNGRIATLQDSLHSLRRAVADVDGEDPEVVEASLKERLQQLRAEHAELQKQKAEAAQELRTSEMQCGETEGVDNFRKAFEKLAIALQRKYQAESYIRQKEAEGAYQRSKELCMGLLGQCEALIKEMQ